MGLEGREGEHDGAEDGVRAKTNIVGPRPLRLQQDLPGPSLLTLLVREFETSRFLVGSCSTSCTTSRDGSKVKRDTSVKRNVNKTWLNPRVYSRGGDAPILSRFRLTEPLRKARVHRNRVYVRTEGEGGSGSIF